MAGSGIYDIFKTNLMNKLIDLEDANIIITLHTSTHGGFDATDTDYDATNEVLEAAPGYDRNTKVLTTPTVSLTTPVAKWTADNVAWTTATFTCRYAVLNYGDIGAAAGLMCCIDFGADQSVAAGTFTIVWDTDGIITLT